jgi:hypothetical protein
VEILDFIKSTIFNIPGWRTNRKIVVFESDDWGSQRMPSKKYFDALIAKGIRVDQSKYDSLDSLEKKEDLELLFDVLQQNESDSNSAPKFTFNAVMGNPDYEAIKESQFEKYVFEPFQLSYEKYYGEDNLPLWKEAMVAGLMKAQFHAKEHLNVALWMRDLKNGHTQTRIAFDHHFYGLKTKTSSFKQKSYLEAYHSENEKELVDKKEILNDGLNMFERNFGFKSATFIACNYVWPSALENTLSSLGIIGIQGQRAQLDPLFGTNKKKVNYHFTGQKNQYGQYYTIRNILFEPYLNQNWDWVNNAMKQIKTSFFWQKPAIISTHRINYASQLSIQNRDQSLAKLDLLFKKIKIQFPDVEFMSSDELINTIESSKKH